MGFPAKKYERLACLQHIWQVSQDDVYYAVENGLLQTTIWLPLRYVERGVIRNRKFIYEADEHLEGFVGVRPEDTREIFSKGSAKLRMFTSIAKDCHMLRLAYEPPQPAIAVRISDLLVLQEHREQFESSHEVTPCVEAIPRVIEPQNFQNSDDYRHIFFNGHEYHFGDVQAKIMQILHDAHRSRNPWVHGKTLMYESGSNALRLRDLFKNKPNWKKLIHSNDRGYYCLNLPSEQFQELPPDHAVKSHRNIERDKRAI
jgi:hypothetical protein